MTNGTTTIDVQMEGNLWDIGEEAPKVKHKVSSSCNFAMFHDVSYYNDMKYCRDKFYDFIA